MPDPDRRPSSTSVSSARRGHVISSATQTPPPADGIEQEQAYIATLYQRLDEMWADAKDGLKRTLRESDGTPQGLTQRDVATRRHTDRLSQLGAAEYGLCFGRLDFNAGNPLYVGRLGIVDHDFETLLVDWRAPAARPFYLATAIAPEGVTRRRHIRTRRRKVVSIDDESLVYRPGDPQPTSSLTGESALLAALGAARTGRMSDIVETIQVEQDRIIRSDVNGALVVQGGPGTGKTAVALHRAAYLLYTHRERLSNRGVLVVGPNSTFLHYIEQVLPALGETAVSLATVGTMFPGVKATATDSGRTALVKADLAMVKVLAAAVADRQQLPAANTVVRFEREQLPVDRGLVATARRRARTSRQPHNRARAIFVSEMINGLAAAYAARLGAGIEDGDRLLDRQDLDDVREELRGDAGVQSAINALWPRLTPQRLLSELFASDAAMSRAGLTPDQRTLLQRPADAAWTVDDVPLLDEAAELLGIDDRAEKARAKRRHESEIAYAQGVLDIIEGSRSAEYEDSEEEEIVASDLIGAHELAERQAGLSSLTTAERASLDREWTYGHVIVDEAQELSPMAWRMLMRRIPTQSMTIVGDVAQTSDPAGTVAWSDALTPYLGNRWRLAELTVNYRTPAEIMTVAADVLAVIDPSRKPPTSVRETGERPVVSRVESGELVPAIVASARREMAAVEGGTTAIIVADDALPKLLAQVAEAAPGLLTIEDVSDQDLRRPLVMLTTRQAKGLEFDAVIVVEPAEIVAESERGVNDLYVALTRPTRRLTVLHTGPLPEPLTKLRV